MTAREEFLAGLEAEYHDDDALRRLPPSDATSDELLVFHMTRPIAAAEQRRLDLYGDLWP